MVTDCTYLRECTIHSFCNSETIPWLHKGKEGEEGIEEREEERRGVGGREKRGGDEMAPYLEGLLSVSVVVSLAALLTTHHTLRRWLPLHRSL